MNKQLSQMWYLIFVNTDRSSKTNIRQPNHFKKNKKDLYTSIKNKQEFFSRTLSLFDRVPDASCAVFSYYMKFGGSVFFFFFFLWNDILGDQSAFSASRLRFRNKSNQFMSNLLSCRGISTHQLPFSIGLLIK